MPDYIPFGWFYLTNLLIGTIFLIGYGIRKNYSAAAWLTVVALLLTLFIAGIKLMGFPVSDWFRLIASSAGDQVYSKFVPGGVLFFAIGLMAVRWFMKLRTSIMDSMIMILPWMLVVQRIGCFINGCCYGRPTNLPWAVSYPAGTSAFDHYMTTGQIHAGELVTCGLHPAQLYMVFGALIVWTIIWGTRGAWKSPGSRGIFGMLLLGMMRFVVEFFRETPAIKWYSQSFLGINYLQWIILVLALAFTLFLIRKERRASPVRVEIPLQENLPRTLITLFIVIFLIWNLRRLFEFQELVLLQILVTFAVAATLYKLFLAVAFSKTRLAFILILLIAFTTMSQDLIKTEADSLRQDPVKTWFNLSIAGSTGNYEHRTKDCQGNITSRQVLNQATGGISLSYHYQPNKQNQFGFGARGWIADINSRTHLQGSYWEDPGSFTYGINPFIEYNRRAIGLGLGLNVFRTPQWPDSLRFLPSVSVRFGPTNVFFFDAGILDKMQINGHLSYFHLGLGSGFRTNGEIALRTGLSFSGFNSDVLVTNFYIMGEFRLLDHLYFSPAIYLGNKAFGSLALSYNFGYREKLTRLKKPQG
ncbi:MAG: prolipoprotein diacylglyceryl transferase [Bacteroidia bacterium]|nr:prolipoprotein diacylglyceryl transferase [Bacteroidia bacterium]